MVIEETVKLEISIHQWIPLLLIDLGNLGFNFKQSPPIMLNEYVVFTTLAFRHTETTTRSLSQSRKQPADSTYVGLTQALLPSENQG